MKILLAGGGTAGHINPALAIAGYIKEKAGTVGQEVWIREIMVDPR